ncbi:MAG: DUF2619 domain-containing protein [Bacillota bacterium]|uniref:DUF2619 domain-containing protein n=1 Tax=Thermanaerosceptrum fracticalcis TaxID=1712410 RepID=A0A7G6E132_THEFR|nr:DUF2619 domain-containing protein [Thermanaerosceptrum fracticalcis]QNB45786.1 DUF2619 domain-containing protein [Thermanaerosceptrum fracticalcis]
MGEDITIKLMFALRILIAVISTGAALLMLKFNTIPDALRINAFVGLVNPIIFLSISLLGIANMASQISLPKLMALIIGVFLVLWGTMK